MAEQGWAHRIERLTGMAREMIQRELQPRKCKHCGSFHVVRFGRVRDTKLQRLRCKDCKRTFVDTDALPGMKTPADQVASALNMYYEGMSLNAIRRHLQQMHNNYPSDSTVYGWLTRFTKAAVRQTKDYQPNVGDVWVADETVLKIGGQKVWFWDIIDARTRYLLASHLSTKRTTHDARVLMARAARKAGKPPKVVITDQLAAYLDGIELNFGSETKHIAAKNLRTSPGTQLIERFHFTLKARTKVMRGLKRIETIRLLLQGWLVHYNYLRVHEALGDRTPAHVAGLKYPFKNWQHIIAGVDAAPTRQRTVRVTSAPPTLISGETSKRRMASPRRKRRPRAIDLGMGIVQTKRGRHLRL